MATRAKSATVAKPRAKTSSAHFSPELFKFLRQLKKNNRREWFDKNKSRYLEQVRDPMLQFIEDYAPRLHTISPYLVADPKPVGGSMFRIYRDVRFSKDKSPYKVAATAQFRHERGKDVHTPGFYLHLGLDGIYVGTGIWRPDGPTVTKIRKALVKDPARWKKILTSKPFKKDLEITGDSLVRPPKGYDPDHPLIEDLKRKDFITMTKLTEKDAVSPKFMNHFTEITRSAGPFMNFLTDAIGVRW